MKTRGILLLDKQAGLTSAKAIAQAKKELRLRKIGHAGTLDPFATGLLVALCGDATRVASYAESGEKEYEGVFRFGMETDSHDITGTVSQEAGVSLSSAALDKLAQSYTGTISQIPPQISALRVGGKRAYALARKGEQVKLSPRQVQVKKLSLEQMNETDVQFSITCSKGTYIRSLARDFGHDLGCGAVVASLRRVASFPFHVRDAFSLAELHQAKLLPWQTLFPHAERRELSDRDARALQCGDERMLERVAADVDLSVNSVVYLNRDNPEQSGLLSREAQGWKFAVNFNSC